jgi:hypothetical protein
MSQERHFTGSYLLKPHNVRQATEFTAAAHTPKRAFASLHLTTTIMITTTADTATPEGHLVPIQNHIANVSLTLISTLT